MAGAVFEVGCGGRGGAEVKLLDVAERFQRSAGDEVAGGRSAIGPQIPQIGDVGSLRGHG